jgi:hypothetical protein
MTASRPPRGVRRGRLVDRPGLRGAAAALLAVASASCAGHLPPCPAAGGPAWTELQGAHFRLRTDLPPAAARAALTDLELLGAALLIVFGAAPDLDTGKVPAVVVDRGWTDFAPHRVGGYFTNVLFQPLVVMTAGSDLHRQQVINHELVHYLSRLVMPRQPLWLSEGLASYYETIEFDTGTGRITVGKPAPERLRFAQHGGLNIEKMFAATEVGEDAGAFYAAAWITTHYLMNHHGSAFNGYEKALRGGASFDAAWRAAFGAQTPAQLATEVQHYLEDGGQYAVLIYRFPPYEPTAPIERSLGDADIHATRALLYATGARTRPTSDGDAKLKLEEGTRGAKRELDEALRQDPDHVAAHAILHWLLGAPIDLERASAATRKSPRDWLAWLLLAQARDQRDDGAGREQAFERAADLASADRSISFARKPAAE